MMLRSSLGNSRPHDPSSSTKPNPQEQQAKQQQPPMESQGRSFLVKAKRSMSLSAETKKPEWPGFMGGSGNSNNNSNSLSRRGSTNMVKNSASNNPSGNDVTASPTKSNPASALANSSTSSGEQNTAVLEDAEKVIRAILGDPSAVLNKTNCLLALRKYATARSEVQQLTEQRNSGAGAKDHEDWQGQLDRAEEIIQELEQKNKKQQAELDSLSKQVQQLQQENSQLRKEPSTKINDNEQVAALKKQVAEWQLKNQTQEAIHATTLEIRDVQVKIFQKERDEALEKNKQLTQKLAKTMKSVAAAAAAVSPTEGAPGPASSPSRTSATQRGRSALSKSMPVSPYNKARSVSPTKFRRQTEPQTPLMSNKSSSDLTKFGQGGSGGSLRNDDGENDHDAANEGQEQMKERMEMAEFINKRNEMRIAALQKSLDEKTKQIELHEQTIQQLQQQQLLSTSNSTETKGSSNDATHRRTFVPSDNDSPAKSPRASSNLQELRNKVNSQAASVRDRMNRLGVQQPQQRSLSTPPPANRRRDGSDDDDDASVDPSLPSEVPLEEQVQSLQRQLASANRKIKELQDADSVDDDDLEEQLEKSEAKVKQLQGLLNDTRTKLQASEKLSSRTQEIQDELQQTKKLLTRCQAELTDWMSRAKAAEYNVKNALNGVNNNNNKKGSPRSLSSMLSAPQPNRGDDEEEDPANSPLRHHAADDRSYTSEQVSSRDLQLVQLKKALEDAKEKRREANRNARRLRETEAALEQTRKLLEQHQAEMSSWSTRVKNQGSASSGLNYSPTPTKKEDDERIAALQKKVQDITLQLQLAEAQLTKQARAHEEQLAKLREELRDSQSKLQETQEKLTDVGKALVECTKKLSAAQGQQAESDKKLEQSRSMMAALKRELAESTAQSASAQRKLADLKENGKEDLQETEALLGESQAEVKQLRQQLSEAERKAARWEEEVKTCRALPKSRPPARPGSNGVVAGPSTTPMAPSQKRVPLRAQSFHSHDHRSMRGVERGMAFRRLSEHVLHLEEQASSYATAIATLKEHLACLREEEEDPHRPADVSLPPSPPEEAEVGQGSGGKGGDEEEHGDGNGDDDDEEEDEDDEMSDTINQGHPESSPGETLPRRDTVVI